MQRERGRAIERVGEKEIQGGPMANRRLVHWQTILGEILHAVADSDLVAPTEDAEGEEEDEEEEEEEDEEEEEEKEEEG